MFRYTPRMIPQTVMVVGCGGTGSRLVPLLAQFLASITKAKNARGWLDNPTILLADFDTIEEKNLLRQNFIQSDVGKHKAAVLAQRYGRAYGVNVLPILEKLDGSGSFARGLASTINWNSMIVIMCVDSAQARRDVLKSINALCRPGSAGQGAFIIDAGNEDNFGQVRFFNQNVIVNHSSVGKNDLPKMSPIVTDIDAIPMDFAFYRDLQDMPGQGSCADLDQTLAINALMATLIMGVVQNFYYVKPFNYNQISISLDGAVSTVFNTPVEFLRRAEYGYEDTQRRGSILPLNHWYATDLGRSLQAFMLEHRKFQRKMDAEAAQARALAERAAEQKKAQEEAGDADERSEKLRRLKASLAAKHRPEVAITQEKREAAETPAPRRRSRRAPEPRIAAPVEIEVLPENSNEAFVQDPHP